MYSTLEEAIEQAAKKRLQKLGKSKNSSSRVNNNSRSGDLLAAAEVISRQEEEEQNEAFELTRNGGDPESETDDSAVQVRRYFVDTAAQLNTIHPSIHPADPDLIDISTQPPGWLLTRLITPVGGSIQSPARRGTGLVYSSFARTTTVATIDELNVLREAIWSKEIGNDSSSQYLMDRRPDQHHLINDPKPVSQ
ncbi:hypothetical protein BGX28_005603 [Mortierella sp. GBA30]|nr:hypothetical protein BGX28_005603 [Mortierella sp. GBA30]